MYLHSNNSEILPYASSRMSIGSGNLRMIALIVVGFCAVFSGRAYACNGNCDELALIFLGVPVAVTTSFVVPLIGKGLDGREHSPYWTAVGFSALSTGAAVAIAYSNYDSFDSDGSQALALLGGPILAGSITTFLVYQFWPRQKDISPENASSMHIPLIGFAPLRGGGKINVSWRF